MKIRKAVIPAAGWGTRFLPLTKSQPKEMLPLVNKSVIQYILEEAVACGIELVIMVTSLRKRGIEEHFDRCFELEDFLRQRGETGLAEDICHLANLVEVCYVHQKQQLGLGHAVLTAQNVVGNEPFILFLPDDLLEYGEREMKQMLDIHKQYESTVLAVKRVARQEVSRYGIIASRKIADRIYQVTDLVEKPVPSEAPSNLAIIGRYVLMPQIFGLLQNTPPNKNNEIQLTDALRQTLERQPVYAYEFEGKCYDLGTPFGWLEAQVEFALRDPDIAPKFRDYLKKKLRDIT